MKKTILATTNPSVSEREKKHCALARRAAAEGIVLLKNDGVLPLKTSRIALFGSGARKTVIGGTGSGAMNERYGIGIEAGLINARYEITTKSWLDRFDDLYEKQYGEFKERLNKKVEGINDMLRIAETVMTEHFLYPAGIEVADEDISNSGTDIAVYVIARQAGEGTDRLNKEGDYKLNELELSNLKKLSDNFRNLILVINVGGFIDLSFLDVINVNALLYCCQPGMEGGNALADIITGIVNPSGKLASTWAKSYDDYPFAKKYSHYGNSKEQDYEEGIYVGYRYFDSFNIAPLFPFGFGLSYTDFSIEVKDITYSKGAFTLDVHVANTGKTAGKEVVQIYLTAPFAEAGTEYQRLVAYCKTEVIAPGESYNAKIEFELSTCASYDEQKAAYVLNPGQYVIRAGSHSRDTVPAAVFNLKKEKIVEICQNSCAPKNLVKEITAQIRKTEDLSKIKVLSVDTSDIVTITYNYDELPVYEDEKIERLIESMEPKDLAKLVVGGGLSGAKIVEVLGASGSTTSELFEKYGIPNVILSDGPAGINVSPEIVVTKDGQVKPTKIYERFDFGFLGQMLRMGLGKAEDGEMRYQYATAFPVGMALAQSWNAPLLEEIGNAIGTEMTEFGTTVWLAPAMNIHRNPLCGRTFEYYSEDPYVSGTLAAAVTKGAQLWNGKFVSIKHFACNNCETDRFVSSSNINERALREIYLKGFEIAVRLSNPGAVMSSYNKINGVYTANNHDLLVKILRNEWGFKGLVMSDWDSVNPGRGETTLALKSQNDLIMPGKTEQVSGLLAGLNDGSVNLNDLKRSAARVLRLIQSNTVCPIHTK